MAESGSNRRRYGDKEVGLILKRAAELQRQEPAAGTEGGGLTLTELEEIAVDDVEDATGSSVRRMFVPEKGDGAEMLDGSADEIADRVAAILNEKRG